MSNVGNVNINIGADISGALSNLKQLEKQSISSANNIKNAFKNVFNTGSSNNPLATAQKSALTIQQALKNSASGLNNGGRTIADYFNRTLSSSVSIKNNIGSLTANASNIGNSLINGTTKATNNTNNMAKNFASMKSDFGAMLVTGTMLKNIGTNFFKSIYQPWKDTSYSSTYADILYNYTETEKTLMDKIVEASASKYAVSQSEIWEAFERAGSSNVSKGASVEAVNGALGLAKTGRIETGEALNLANVLIKSFENDDASKFSEVYDKLLVTQKVANTKNIESMRNGLLKYASNFANSNIDLDTYLALEAEGTYAFNPDQASRSINTLLRTINKPQKGAIAEANKWGLNFATATDDIVGFLEQVKKLNLNETQLQKLFSSDVSKTGFNAITNDLDGVRAKLDEIKNSTGAVDTALQQLEVQPWYQLEQAQQSFANAKISMMEALAPALQTLANIIGNLSNIIKNFTPEQKKMIGYFMVGITVLGGFLVIVGTLGLLLSSLGSIFTFVGGIINMFGNLLSALGIFITGTVIPTFTQFGIAGLASALAPIAGFMALGYALLMLQNNFGGFGNWFKGIWIGIQATFLAVLKVILMGIDYIGKSLADVMSKFSTLGKASATFKFLGMDGLAEKLDGFNYVKQIGNGASAVAQAGIGWVEGQGNRLAGESAEVNAKANLTWDTWDWNPFDNLVQSVKDKASGLFSKFNFGSELEGLMGEWKGEDTGKGLIPEILPEGFDNNQDILDTLYPGGSSGSGSNKANQEAEKYAQGIETIENSIKDLIKSFKDSIGMFDKYTKKIISSSSLLNKNKQRANAFSDWKTAQESLMTNANLSVGTKEEISKMGVDKLAELQSLLRMSPTQLKEWDMYNRQIETNSKDVAIQSTYYNQVTVKLEGLDVKAMADAIYKELKRKGLV